jgi:hypothetical protein
LRILGLQFETKCICNVVGILISWWQCKLSTSNLDSQASQSINLANLYWFMQKKSLG